MCTASWFFSRTGYELYFNRDESVARTLALGPRSVLLAGVRALAPCDPEGGGTWIGVNEHGLALGLLNARHTNEERDAPRSRGLLVRELLPAGSLEALDEALRASALGRYRAFTLVARQTAREPRAWAWDGRALAARSPDMPLCSSSLDSARAAAVRRRTFERRLAESGEVDPEFLEGFHRSHEPERGPWSPCMHRDVAHTVSASHVRVTCESISMRYAPGAPCTTAFGPEVEL